MLGLYGGADAGIPRTQIDKHARRARRRSRQPQVEIVVYPDTPHAFNADYRPSYRKEPAEDGWKQALAWFKANGVTRPARLRHAAGIQVPTGGP